MNKPSLKCNDGDDDAHGQSQTGLIMTQNINDSVSKHENLHSTTPANCQNDAQLSSNPDNTLTFLVNFNLVAEAAKRAQIAILMQDLETIRL